MHLISDKEKTRYMKNNFTYFLKVLVVFSFILAASSCENFNKEDAVAKSLTKAENFLKKYPDSTLNIANKLLASKSFNNLSKKNQLAIFQLKQQAFSNLEKMDSVLALGKKVRLLAAKIPDSIAIAKSLLLVKGDIDFSAQQEIEPYFLGAIATLNKNKMRFDAAKLSSSYGTILCHKGDFVKAQTYLLNSYKELNELDSIRATINVCMNIGSTYSYTKNNKKALEYYTKAYSAAIKVKDSNSICSVLINLGTYYADDVKNHDKALDSYRKASLYLTKKTGAFLKMKIDYNAAVSLFAKGDLVSSEQTFQSMLNDCVSINAYEGVAMASKGLGDLYIKKNQTSKALTYLNRGIHLADSLGMSYEALQMRPSLLTLYKKNNDFRAALQVSEQMKTNNDAILSAEKQNAVNELEIKYQSEKKAAEIVYLKSLSSARQLMLYGLSFFIIVLFFVLRKQKILYKQKQYSYTLLMQQYKAERQERLSELKTEMPEVSNSIEEVTAENKDLYAKLIAYYEKEKPYLNPKLKADDIAKALQVQPRTITAFIKANGYNGFNNFNNKYRIIEVKRQFEDLNCANVKMEVIASNSGFGNKQTFYTAFEEFTGLNPGYYRAEILK